MFGTNSAGFFVRNNSISRNKKYHNKRYKKKISKPNKIIYSKTKDVIFNKTLCLTYKSIDQIPDSRINMWKNALPVDWDIELYGDKECEEFILKYYSEKEYNNFKKLIYGPIKSDYFRSLYMYMKGGMYCDIDAVLNVLSFDPSEYFIKGKITTINSDNSNQLNPMLILCDEKHRIMKQLLDKYDKMFKKNISTDKYWTYSIVPLLSDLRKIYKYEFYIPFQEKYGYRDMIYFNNEIIMYNRGDDYDKNLHKFK